MKINLGSGPKHHDGWVEFDSSLNILLSKFSRIKSFLIRLNLLNPSQSVAWDPEIIRANIIKLQFKENSISSAYLSHVLEHVYRSESQQILKNIYFGLKPGGVLRICSPDYDAFITKYLNEKSSNFLEAANSFEKSLLSYPESRPTNWGKIRRILGGHTHFWHPFVPQLEEQLRVAGFKQVNQFTFKEGNMDGISEVEYRDDNSFFLEARK